MGKFSFNEEWEFVVAETHKKYKKQTCWKREVLFALQIFLENNRIENFLKLKRIYCKIN